MKRLFFELLLFLLLPYFSSAATCHGEEILDPSGQNCFIILADQKTFHDAEKACFDYGGYHLAAVPTIIDNNFLLNLTRYSGYGNNYWIGATDLTSDGNWQWIDGTTMRFQNWSPKSDSSRGFCAVMSTTDGRWLAAPCNQYYPAFCYSRAKGAPTPTPTPARPTTIATRKETVFIKFMGDAESAGNPNNDGNIRQFYANQREFIRSIADNLFDNPSNLNNVCKYYANVAFYGYGQYQQNFASGPAWSKNEFDNLLEGNDWSGQTTLNYNITDAITGAQSYRWSPALKDLGYTTLVFLTSRKSFDKIPSLFDPWPKFDQVIVVSIDNSPISVPYGADRVDVSNSFSDNDIQSVLNVLKCH